MSFQQKNGLGLALAALIATVALLPGTAAAGPEVDHLLDEKGCSGGHPPVEVSDSEERRYDRYDPSLVANDVTIPGNYCGQWQFSVKLFGKGKERAGYGPFAVPKSGVYRYGFSQPCLGRGTYWARVITWRDGHNTFTQDSNPVIVDCQKADASLMTAL